jgi:chemotaxis protein methyltransferase CheR
MASTPRWQALLQDPRFSRFKAWIIEHTGLAYYEDKDRDLAFALERCFAEAVELSAREVFELVESEPQALEALVEQLTIGETFFFRHAELFEALREIAIPDILKRKSASRSLRIWSAGCSIGAEPYSLAILLCEYFAFELEGWNVEIIGTDINRRFLKIASSASYDAWALRGLPGKILDRYFERKGTKWVVKASSRKGVRFSTHNLVADPFPDVSKDLYGFDLIVCRNVMIYFDLATNQRLVEHFGLTLNPEGWLAVGHAEPHTETFRAFRTVNAPGAVLYQRKRPHHGQDKEEPKAGQRASFVLFPVEARPLPHPPVPPDVPPAAPPPAKPALGQRRANPKEQGERLDIIAQLANGGDVTAARRRCELLLAEAPLEPAVHLYYGMLLVQLGEWDEAVHAFRRCLYLDRQMPLAHYYLGLAQERLGRDGRRDFRNGLQTLAKESEDELVREGHGLTVHELRTLLNASMTLAE